MSLKWWEKTVEYFFIRNCIGDSMVIAPLDGKEERAGDSIFSQGNKWVLIEFKNKLESLKSEEDKFSNFETAKAHFLDKDSHHFLVYGGMFENKEKNGQKFGISVTTYFSRNSVKNVKSMLSAGLEGDDFFAYIKDFTSFKKVSGESGGGLSFESYGLVAGINSENQIVECISLAELGQELGLDLTPEVTPEPPSPSPSPSSSRGMSGPGGM
ncbi:MULTISPECIES: hypothetical protein [Pseudoalteromonas]|mgnify:CR=1 FL=1|uniref:Uncharacterized protein n=1 Tax=Pseudoalteromonas agarivorans DSM 14585 TaxID=1312369 RepID=A0ACA8DVV2_9GAMM|nr:MULTISPECIES: hypothetical protein [Pseudoalteromonas]ATC82292.1 hypothetical protein PAGA_a1948 [Pseudoalteromonas agarivorans DSM 14585]MCK8094238.1 hypothetical protein [Pseudoalteromonas sp. 1CM17D]